MHLISKVFNTYFIKKFTKIEKDKGVYQSPEKYCVSSFTVFSLPLSRPFYLCISRAFKLPLLSRSLSSFLFLPSSFPFFFFPLLSFSISFSLFFLVSFTYASFNLETSQVPRFGTNFCPTLDF